uniref:UvrD-helicase domain-containing protein n=1 Tax=uncultured Duncaniella sp. TaxID=2768039 RepID=UPI0025B44676
MQLIPFVVLISIVVIAIIRIYLKNKSKKLSEKFNCISSYSEKSSYEEAKERLSKRNDAVFVDIQTDLNNSFNGKIVSATEEDDFINHYVSHFKEAYSLAKTLKTFNITPSATITNLIHDFGNIKKLIRHHNNTIIDSLLDTHKDFFDHCLKYPLDKQQRRSIVSEENNCLVISSAGSGKTSTIVGKVKYLTEVKGVAPHRILLISYTNKAAAELTERIATQGLNGYTFHKLAIDIIGKETGVKPSICDNTDVLFIDIYHTLLTRVRDKNFMIFNQAKDIEYWAAFQGRLIYLYSLVLLIPEDKL